MYIIIIFKLNTEIVETENETALIKQINQSVLSHFLDVG